MKKELNSYSSDQGLNPAMLTIVKRLIKLSILLSTALFSTIGLPSFASIVLAEGKFNVFPYLQNPQSESMTVIWFTNSKNKSWLSYREEKSNEWINITSIPNKAQALSYTKWESETFFEGKATEIPFQHKLRLEGLKPDTIYQYKVTQEDESFSAIFKTAPVEPRKLRFIVYADSETEPESKDKLTRWDVPYQGEPHKRLYLIDQTKGYQNNLDVIYSRQPDLVLIAGDLVQSGGEQRDWDEFWRHNTHANGQKSLASNIPIVAAVGNHEYHAGPKAGGFSQPSSEKAINKFLTYFVAPSNNATNKAQDGRYYSMEYGPVTLIMLDLCNNGVNKSSLDTNFYLLGENDKNGGHAPSFDQQSQQYQWLKLELAKAQQRSDFTFVTFHHAPYSSGNHGEPAGEDKHQDKQSGRAVRLLTPLFMRYGVDLVFNGHDEMLERSKISGMEINANGEASAHDIHYYDVGIGGDGLRAPMPGLSNTAQQFLAHQDAPEIWKNGTLIEGGKHYGHLEVDIEPLVEGGWKAVLKPVYILPIKDKKSTYYNNYLRKVYNDKLTIFSND